MLSDRQWDERYRQQAGWTQALREHIFQSIGLTPGQRVLEVGCGTGAVTAHLVQKYPVHVFGLDHNAGFLSLAREEQPGVGFVCADALNIPFRSRSFDVTLSHMFLLWMSEPQGALAEMRRVTRAGGWLLALAEPDYRGRIDYPQGLEDLGRLQAGALRRQGANPDRGRELAHLFIEAGLVQVKSGLLGGQFTAAQAMQGFEEEWQVIQADLEGQDDPAVMDGLRRLDEAARRKGERILFVPTFYAIGKVP
jgi:SAM-dependent methyltransferase